VHAAIALARTKNGRSVISCPHLTLVYRRQGAEWWLVHRHADPLVRDVGLKTAAALARGADLDEK
jgi:hypothetical protein